MKKVLLGLGIGAMIFVVCVAILANMGDDENPPETREEPVSTPQPAVVSDITFAEVNSKFGSDGTLTDLQKDREWEAYEGKCVEWTGELVHLDESMFGGYNIGFKHQQYTLTYDVLLDAGTESEETLLTMRQGARYTYKATLKDYGGALLPITGDFGCRRR